MWRYGLREPLHLVPLLVYVTSPRRAGPLSDFTIGSVPRRAPIHQPRRRSVLRSSLDSQLILSLFSARSHSAQVEV